MTSRGERMARAREERARRMEAQERLGRGFEDVFEHLARTGKVFRGECPVCCHTVKGQYQQQTATVSCSCGHSVTLRQWQHQN